MKTSNKKIALRSARAIFLSLFLIWFFLFFAYFLRTNWHLVHNQRYTFGVFSALFGRYTFSLQNSPPLEVLQALLVLAMTHGLGLLSLKALGIKLGAWERHTLAFPLGFGVSGIAFEWLTMARLLYPAPAWLLWIVLYGAIGWIAYRRPLKNTELLEEETATEEGSGIALPTKIDKRLFWTLAVAITALISLAALWHAVFFPETYWDSLILYLGYARMTFFEHGFPFKAEAQVGIGLGANYPHMYPNYGAHASMLFADWSDMHQRLAAPLAAMLTCLTVYAVSLRVWRSHTVAAATMLLYRAIPYGIAYATYASDYSYAILVTASFLLSVAIFAKAPRRGTLILMTAFPVMGMHLNYLMGILWVPWALAVYLAFFTRSQGWNLWKPAWRVMRIRFFWTVYIVGVLIAVTWNMRNWVLTGNPVYSFFPEIFTSSIRINSEVLRSAEMEWFRHGDGIGRVAEQMIDFESGEYRELSDPNYRRQAGLFDRLDGSWLFWSGFEVMRINEDGTLQNGYPVRRVAHLAQFWKREPPDTYRLNEEFGLFRFVHAWKMLPLFPGLFFPLIVFVAAIPGIRRLGARAVAVSPEKSVTLGVTGLLTLCLFAYMYLLADFYLYQIIPVIVCVALLVGWVLYAMERQSLWRRVVLWPMWAVILLQGLVPGLAFALVNFKQTSPREIYGQYFDAIALDTFRNPGMSPEIFYRWRFGGDWDMWQYLNENLKDERLLTHENRHYVIDPSIQLVHLDDWEVQSAYDIEDPDALYEFLTEHDIRYYLRIPKEANHYINRELGMDMLLEEGYLEPVYTTRDGQEETVLYQLVEPVE